MKFLNWIKGLFTYSDLVERIKDHDERIHKLEIENSAMKTSLRIIENGLEIKYNGKK